MGGGAHGPHIVRFSGIFFPVRLCLKTEEVLCQRMAFVYVTSPAKRNKEVEINDLFSVCNICKI